MSKKCAVAPPRKPQGHSVGQLLKLAVKVFNTYIRQRDKFRLHRKCYTCGKEGTEAGHFIHNKNAVKFDEINVNLQCGTCNRWQSGNLGEYAIRLIKEYGMPAVEALKKRAEQIHRFSRKELEDIIAKYKSLLESM